MTNNIKQFISNISSNKMVDATNNFNEIMKQKVVEKLEAKRIFVASTMCSSKTNNNNK